MYKYRLIDSLSLKGARVLLEPETSKALFGKDLAMLPGDDDSNLTNVLISIDRNNEYWTKILTRLYVKLLEVNQAPRDSLLRIPGLSSEQVDLFMKFRPYFTLADISREGSDLQEVILIAAPYLTHEGYEFMDKPRGTTVQLDPSNKGLIIKLKDDVNLESFKNVLSTAGLKEKGRDAEELLLVSIWQIPASEIPQRLRILKEREEIKTVAPLLKDNQEKVRIFYPDRLDLALHEDADPGRWEEILLKFKLSLVQRYSVNYGSVRLERDAHDLGALYRALRMVAEEPDVKFVEPTYINVEIN